MQRQSKSESRFRRVDKKLHKHICVLFFTLSLPCFASTVAPPDQSIKVIARNNLASDMVNIAPANSAGTTTNRFSQHVKTVVQVTRNGEF